jgi:glycine betaine/proline transport system substrate-binding protein
MLKAHWKRWLIVAAVLALVVSLVGACQPAAPAAEEQPAEEEEPAEKPHLKFYDGSWESLWISNAIAQYILEKGYGYTTETVVLDTPVMQVSLANGDVHVNMEMWRQNIQAWYDEETAKGNIITYAAILEGGPQFWMIPKWVADEYNIKTVFDMKDHWELFKDPEDPTKGAFINCKIGWQCGEINRVKMETYGLTDYYNIISPGSAGAMDAALSGAQKKREPVFGYYWAPTALMGMYDWYILEEPEYDEDIWADVIAAKDDKTMKIDAACAYPSVPLTITVHKSVPEIAPEAAAMFKKMVIGLDAMNKMAAWSTENEVSDYKETAIWYLRNYESTWKTWVTADAFNKVKAALAKED